MIYDALSTSTFGQRYLIWAKTMTKGSGRRTSIQGKEMDSHLRRLEELEEGVLGRNGGGQDSGRRCCCSSDTRLVSPGGAKCGDWAHPEDRSP